VPARSSDQHRDAIDLLIHQRGAETPGITLVAEPMRAQTVKDRPTTMRGLDYAAPIIKQRRKALTQLIPSLPRAGSIIISAKLHKPRAGADCGWVNVYILRAT